MAAINAPLNRKLRMALVGGGGAAFIGRVHATAATLDNRAELVAGVLSSNPEKAKQSAPTFGIAADRAYGTIEEMIESEKRRDDGVDFISVATPNGTHHEIAKAAIEAGFNVVCDKPMTTTLKDARELVDLVHDRGVVFALTHNYSGYPLMRQARQMVAEGDLGQIEAVRSSYIQGWLRGMTPDATPARGAWKNDPKLAGPSGALGDIGTHAFHLACYIAQLRPVELSCHLRTRAPGRTMDDYGHALVRFENDALCMVTFSQVTHGRLNDLTLEVDGTTGSLRWNQEHPNQMELRRHGQPQQTLERHPAAEYGNEWGRAACRIPPGHPEAFLEAFANVYRSAFDAMIARSENASPDPSQAPFPTVDDGLLGVDFIEQCLASHQAGGQWRRLGEQ